MYVCVHACKPDAWEGLKLPEIGVADNCEPLFGIKLMSPRRAASALNHYIISSVIP